MDEIQSPGPRGRGIPLPRVITYVVGGLLCLFAILLLAWWLPARAAAGYLIPESRGVIAEMPSTLEVIWIRPWPWSTMPPTATVTLSVPGGQKALFDASAAPVSLFSGRASAVDLSLSPPTESGTSFQRSGLITRIAISWQGGRTERTLTDLWAVRAVSESGVDGFGPLMASPTANPNTSPLAITFSAPPESIVAVSSPNPTAGPWQTPLCMSTKDVTAATSTDSQATIHQLSAGACAHLTGPEAVVETGRNPSDPVAFYWDTVVQEISKGKIVTAMGGGSEVGYGVLPNSFNWWWFTRGN